MAMKTISRFLIAAVLCLAVGVAPALADTLEMKDGRVIQGKYVGGTQNNVRFMVDGRIQLFPVADILAITFGEEAPKPAASTAPPKSTAATSTQTAARSRTSTQTVTVPAGTRILVRMIDGVDSETNRVGDRFRASLEEDLVVNDVVVATKGSDVTGRLVEAKEAGRLAGRSELRLELTDLFIEGQPQPIITGEYEVAGAGRGGDTAKKVGVGAAVGAVIGAVAGGGKGAAIGAGVGAGAGTAIQVLTKGEQVRVPSETMLEFTLEQSFTTRGTNTSPR